MVSLPQLATQIAALQERVNALSNNVSGVLGWSNQAGAGSWTSTGSWEDFSSGNWPYIDFTVPPSGKILVFICFNGTTTPGNWMSCGFRITGTDTVSASYRNAVRHGGGGYGNSKVAAVWPLTVGASNTLIPQWRCDSGTSPSGDDGTGRMIILAG